MRPPPIARPWLTMVLVAVVGFALGLATGATVHAGGPPDWTAIAALATFSAVLVALAPLFQSWATLRRQAFLLRLQIGWELLWIEQHIVKPRHPEETKKYGGAVPAPLDEREIAALESLANMRPQLHLLDPEEFEAVSDAIGSLQPLMLSLEEPPSSTDLIEAMASIEAAHATLDQRHWKASTSKGWRRD